MNKQLPSIEEAVDNFRSAYEALLRRPDGFMAHMNLNKIGDRDVLLVLAVDANIEHGFNCMTAIEKVNKDIKPTLEV